MIQDIKSAGAWHDTHPEMYSSAYDCPVLGMSRHGVDACIAIRVRSLGSKAPCWPTLSDNGGSKGARLLAMWSVVAEFSKRHRLEAVGMLRTGKKGQTWCPACFQEGVEALHDH